MQAWNFRCPHGFESVEQVINEARVSHCNRLRGTKAAQRGLKHNTKHMKLFDEKYEKV